MAGPLPLLAVHNLQVGFKQQQEIRPALKGISFEVHRGEIVAIVGESGSGKSVSSLSILQLLPKQITKYQGGQILFSPNGQETADMLQLSESALRRVRGKHISMIFQEPMSALNPVFTCGNQVMEAIRTHTPCSRSAARKKTIELFRKVRLPDPEELVKKYPHQLSGGQKQRVMIAMAISCAPALLIADEPTTALDVTVQQNILQLLANLQAQTNMGLLFITHDLGLVRDFAHRVIVLYKGEIVESGPCQEVFSNPAHPYTKALLACRPILYKKGQVLPVVDDFLTSSSIAFPEKNGLQHPSPVNSANDQQVLLQINSLKVWYPKKTALFGKPLSFTKAVDELSLDIYKGEILGIVGESGCGKTSLGRALLQLVPITGGTVLLEGKNLTALPKKEWRDLRKQLQLVFQDPYGSLNPRRTIGEAIRETLAVHQPALPISRQIEKVTELLERVHLLPEHYNRYPHAFSGGQRQRIGIARALALEPRFIVFDESVSALDVSVQAQVLNLINELKAVYGFTAVFITHDLGVVQYISDRIVVMDRGKIVEIGDTEQVINNPSSPVTRRLLDALPGKGNFAR